VFFGLVSECLRFGTRISTDASHSSARVRAARNLLVLRFGDNSRPSLFENQKFLRGGCRIEPASGHGESAQAKTRYGEHETGLAMTGSTGSNGNQGTTGLPHLTDRFELRPEAKDPQAASDAAAAAQTAGGASAVPSISGPRPSRGTPHASTFAPPTGVIFAGRSGLDFLELRLGVVRIPEVSRRIREAQSILDQTEYERIDLFNAIVTEDDAFNRNIKMKSLLAAIVQVGLYDRYRRTQKQPDVLIGNSNGDSALMVCVGQMKFEELVRQSSALSTLKLRPQDPPAPGATTAPTSALGASAAVAPNAANAAPALPTLVGLPLPGAPLPGVASMSPAANPSGALANSLGNLPSLSGMSLSEFKAYVRTEDGGLAENQAPSMDLKKLVGEVVEHALALRFVNIGPAAALRPQDYDEAAVKYGVDEVTVIDSIDLDPMLSWFWKEVRPLALAN